MPLESTDQIDVISTSPAGRVELIITDAGVTQDPAERRRLLEAKVATYAAYVTSAEFRTEHPDKSEADCDIVVVAPVAIAPEEIRGLPSAGVAVTSRVFPPPSAPSPQGDVPREKNAAPKNPETLLLQAALKNDLAMMEEALASGADPNGPDFLGEFPVDLAIHHGNEKMLGRLFDAGAEFPQRSRRGRSLWVAARARGRAGIEKILIDRGVKPRLSDRIAVFLVKMKSPPKS